MAKFGLIKSFDIDSGELNGLTLQHCFVLGYELSQIDDLLEAGKEINKPVHAANRDRIEKSCSDSGRQYILKWTPADPSESWMQLWVQGEAPRQD